MATDTCTLFATLIDTEVRAWSAVESALSEAGNALTILTVTDRGLAHLEEACAVVEKEQERLFAPLSTAQREELTRCLALIAEAAKERA